MKYTLNQKGQAAIVKWLGEIGADMRPWGVFADAESEHNKGYAAVSLHRAYKPLQLLHLEPSWFDIAIEPATLNEVVAMLKALRPHFIRSGDLCQRIDALLARCPKE